MFNLEPTSIETSELIIWKAMKDTQTHHNFVSLSYKNFFGLWMLIVLAVILVVCGAVAIFVYPSSGSQSTPHGVGTFLGHQVPLWLIGVAWAVPFLAIAAFLINQVVYFFFISDKIDLFQHLDGFPLEPQTLFNNTDVPEAWFKENFRQAAITKKELKRIIKAFNRAKS